MRNYMYEYGTSVGGSGIFSMLISLVILADLVLLGVFLWKQIQKK
jgi:hypothetical protein